jgi:hypothetical protein
MWSRKKIIFVWSSFRISFLEREFCAGHWFFGGPPRANTTYTDIIMSVIGLIVSAATVEC